MKFVKKKTLLILLDTSNNPNDGVDISHVKTSTRNIDSSTASANTHYMYVESETIPNSNENDYAFVSHCEHRLDIKSTDTPLPVFNLILLMCFLGQYQFLILIELILLKRM